MKVTFFTDQYAKTKRTEDLTLAELYRLIKTKKAATKEKLPWLKLATFGNKRTDKGSLRHDENVTAITGVEADYDAEQIPFEQAVATMADHRLRAIVYTSASHSPTKPRWRILCPTSRPLSPTEREKLVARLNGLLDGKLKGDSFALSQAYFYGHAKNNPVYKVKLLDGDFVDDFDFIDQRDDLDATATGRSNGKVGGGLAGPVLDWAKVEDISIEDVAPKLNEKGQIILANDGDLDALNDILLTTGKIPKPYPSWSEVMIALAGVCKAAGLPNETIAAVLLSDLPCNQHVLRHESERDQQRAVERALFRSYEPDTPRHLPEGKWPAPPDDAAYYGLAGEIVRAIGPHSEADPVSLLVQFLTAFGNCIGRTAYFKVEGDAHHSNINVLLVGETAKARKGTSWGRVREVMTRLDPEWVKYRVQGGLSSGEGLIWAVRDEILKADDEEQVVDIGIGDKRLLIMATEFAASLRVMARDGNSLSQVIRDAWDRGNLASLTKNSPARATDAHISIIGHCTAEELQRNLDATEVANGFANRFLFFCVRRSRLLPFAGDREKLDEALQPLGARLDKVFSRAKSGLREVTWHKDARPLWEEAYADLSEGKPGMFGAVTARAEAQVTRLALIYALIDGKSVIMRPHLEAALALWRYAEASAAFIFGKSLGDPIAGTILRALRKGNLSRTQIAALFARHIQSSKVDAALERLANQRLAAVDTVKTSGRSIEEWHPIP